jgi:hypothetical protein
MNDPRYAVAAVYHLQIKEAVWQAFVGQFKAISAKSGVDFGLLNKAAFAAFVDCAARIAVDDGISADDMVQIVRRVHQDAYARAPKFG